MADKDISARTCSVDGCNSRHKARGLCCKHYQRWKLYGDTDKRKVRGYRRRAECLTDGCRNAPYRTYARCKDCHNQYKRTRLNAKCKSPGCNARATIQKTMLCSTCNTKLLNADKKCSVDGCHAIPIVNGMCNIHDERMKRKGHTDRTRRAPVDVTAYVNWLLSQDTNKCIIWPYRITSHGYAAGALNGEENIARALLKMAVGDPPSPQHQAAHNCGNRACVNVKNHIRWATPVENSTDRYAHGTMPMGEECYLAKLKESDIRRIRFLKESCGLSLASIGKLYDVHKSTIGRIVCYDTWKHVI